MNEITDRTLPANEIVPMNRFCILFVFERFEKSDMLKNVGQGDGQILNFDKVQSKTRTQIRDKNHCDFSLDFECK